MNKAMSVLLAAALVVFLLGCATIKESATTGAVGLYEAEESGRHWVRPSEVCYELGDIMTFSLKIETGGNKVGEALVLGYPQPGQEANRYVSLAAAQAVAEARIDGIYITNYTVDRMDASGVVLVHLQGRALTLKNLGMVDAERADKERFTVVVEKDPDTGITKSYTIPVSRSATGPTTPLSSVRTGLSKGALVAIDASVFAVAGAAGGFFIMDGMLEAGIPLAVTSFGALVKLVIDLVR